MATENCGMARVNQPDQELLEYANWSKSGKEKKLNTRLQAIIVPAI